MIFSVTANTASSPKRARKSFPSRPAADFSVAPAVTDEYLGHYTSLMGSLGQALLDNVIFKKDLSKIESQNRNDSHASKTWPPSITRA